MPQCPFQQKDEAQYLVFMSTVEMQTRRIFLTLSHSRINPNQLNAGLSPPFSNYIKNNNLKTTNKKTPGDSSYYNQFDFVAHCSWLQNKILITLCQNNKPTLFFYFIPFFYLSVSLSLPLFLSLSLTHSPNSLSYFIFTKVPSIVKDILFSLQTAQQRVVMRIKIDNQVNHSEIDLHYCHLIFDKLAKQPNRERIFFS